MENLVVSTRKKLTMDKMFAQVKITAQNTIKSVLNVSVVSQIGSCDCINGSVSISGKISATMVYLNTENKIETAMMTSDFIEKQKADFSLIDASAVSEVVLESVSFSSNEAMISVSHTAKVEGLFNYEMPKIAADQNGLVLATDKFEFKNIKGSSSDAFVVAEEYQSSFEEAEVLTHGSSVVIQNVSAGVDRIVVEGKVLTEVACLVNDNIEKVNRELEFKQEIELGGTMPNMSADAVANVKNAIVTIENKAGKAVLVYSIEIFAKVYAFEDSVIELVEDLYSLKQELTATYGYLNVKSYKDINSVESMFSGMIDISNIDSLDDVICVLNNGSKIDGIVEESDRVVMSCKQEMCVVYKTESGVESTEESVDFEIEMNKDEHQKLSSATIDTELLSYKVKAGREIEVSCRCHSGFKFESETSKQYITKFETVGDKTEDLHGIKVYVTKEGQTLFEVAKILNVTPETLKEQNEIDEVFEKGQKIYVYSPVNLA